MQEGWVLNPILLAASNQAHAFALQMPGKAATRYAPALQREV